MTIKKYNILESELSSRAYEAGNLYFCYDTNNIYYDSIVNEKRLHVNENMVIVQTEEEISTTTNPILYKIYYVNETGNKYIYTDTGWINIGGSSWEDLENKPFGTINGEDVPVEDKYISDNILRIDDITQSDYDQNDSSSLDHIKNRPFYKETREITWDGDTTGKTVVDDLYYKVAEIDHGIDYKSMNRLCTIEVANINNQTTSVGADNLFDYLPDIYISNNIYNGLVYSINGKQWNPTNVASGVLRPIIYDNGMFITMSANDSCGIYYSIDGMTWNKSNITSGTFKSIRYNNDIWVACNYDDDGLYYSTDGMTWTQSNVTSGTFYNVEYNNGLWVAVCKSSNVLRSGVCCSTDGMTWSQHTSISGGLTDIHYLNNIWIAFNYLKTNSLYYSIDGITWTKSNSPQNVEPFDAKYLNNIYIVGTNNNTGLFYSTDGMTWNQSNVTEGSFYGNIIYYNNILIAAAGNSRYGIWYSTDGMTWTQTNINDTHFTDLTNNDDIAVAYSFYNTGLYYSRDGMTWTQSNITTGNFSSVCYGNGIWIAGSSGSGGTLYYSTDGMVWYKSDIYKSGASDNIIYCERNAWSLPENIVTIVTRNNTIVNNTLFEEPGVYFLNNGYAYTSKLKWEYIDILSNSYLDNNIFIAYYGVTTYKEIEVAKNNGKTCICIFKNNAYNVVATLIEYNSSYMRFNYLDGNSRNHGIFIYSSDNRWTNSTTSLQQTSNLTTLIDSGCTDTQYPSAKAVHTHVVEAIDSLYVDPDTVINSESTHDTGPSAKAVYDYVNNIFGLSN